MKHLIITLQYILLTLIVEAQVPQTPTNLQSPNAAGLGLYGEVPVSLFTGIPEISIPLFNAPDKYNNFSIGLSYHAGGVHPDQHPGWVGTNWTLMTGGCITRVVKGIYDDILAVYPGDITQAGYYYTCSAIDGSLDIPNVNYSLFDTDPDEFSFNFGQYSGKFYLNNSQQLVVKCNMPVKISFFISVHLKSLTVL